MDPMLVISPHLDDAVLSMGQVLAGREDSLVMTVFAGRPVEHASTTFDRNCGWPNAGAAHDGRLAEDAAAVHLLRGAAVRCDFLDSQYREVGLSNHTTASEDEIAGTIRFVANGLHASLGVPVVVAGPLGLAHPDHHIVRRAVEKAANDLGPDVVELWLYEDLPARILWPEQVPDALAWWRGMGWNPELDFLGTGDLVIKEAAVRCYRSQLWAPEFGGEALHHVLVPERLWRLTRA